MKLRLRLIILLFIIAVVNSFATTKRYKIWTEDIANTEISVLTCSPGQEIYSIFGHTAIRVKNANTGLDAVVNYGLFDFNQDSFVYRFVKGETDYMCGIDSFNSFLFSYAWRGSGVKATVLDLTDTEKERIIRLLTNDLKPENREYRYNFAYNNCATKIRDIVKFAYSDKCESIIPSEYTYRNIIRKYAENYPWFMFSFDICLGGKAYNTLMTPDEAQFLPELLNDALNNCLIGRDGEEIKPNTRQEVILTPMESTVETSFFTPMVVACIVLLLSLISLIFGSKCPIASKIYNGTLLSIYFIVGIVVAFLIFFSEHPFTSGNMNICIFNPLLIVPIICLISTSKSVIFKIARVILILMAAFFIVYCLIFWHFTNHAFIPLAITLILELNKQIIKGA